MDNSYINAFRHFLYVLTRRKTEVVFIFLSLRLGNVVINHDMMVTLDCHDPHWLPQWPVIEEKFWKKITFIGFMELVSSDAKTLLESLSSSSDGKNSTAWETHGKNGWGKNHNEGFMQRNAAGHSANAAERLCQIVKPEDETFVEEHWHMEWEHREYMGYEKKTLCNATS